MRCYIIIPCHNEASFIGKTLDSLINQSVLPKKIIVVDDQSTDASAQIIKTYTTQYSYIQYLSKQSSDIHLPGSKVIQAFQKGLDALDSDYDIICKFDADLIFPENYLETIISHFNANPKIGMVGGFCYIQKKSNWVLENLTNKDHIRGALKAYRKACFEAIGGLKPAMGWDTVDELLAQYHGWKIHTDPLLNVKHLKPTGNTYSTEAKLKQGEAFYRLRYGRFLTIIAASKLAMRKKQIKSLNDYIKGYSKAKKNKAPFLVSEDEGKFIRTLRWKGIKKKLGLTN